MSAIRNQVRTAAGGSPLPLRERARVSARRAQARLCRQDARALIDANLPLQRWGKRRRCAKFARMRERAAKPDKSARRRRGARNPRLRQPRLTAALISAPYPDRPHKVSGKRRLSEPIWNEPPSPPGENVEIRAMNADVPGVHRAPCRQLRLGFAAAFGFALSGTARGAIFARYPLPICVRLPQRVRALRQPRAFLGVAG